MQASDRAFPENLLEEPPALSAHVCSRMLTYASVCSRMLTYAHVCLRMQASDRAFPENLLEEPPALSRSMWIDSYLHRQEH